jgi:hypothetical protein
MICFFRSFPIVIPVSPVRFSEPTHQNRASSYAVGQAGGPGKAEQRTEVVHLGQQDNEGPTPTASAAGDSQEVLWNLYPSKPDLSGASDSSPG